MRLGFKIVGKLLLTASHMEVGLAVAGRPDKVWGGGRSAAGWVAREGVRVGGAVVESEIGARSTQPSTSRTRRHMHSDTLYVVRLSWLDRQLRTCATCYNLQHTYVINACIVLTSS
jgi:hypothetical protein